MVSSVELPPLLNESTLTFYLSHFIHFPHFIHNVERGGVKRTSVGEVHEGTIRCFGN
jgi:hypothetical protein